MHHSFKKLFHLQGLTVLDSRLEGETMVISVKPTRKTTACKCCGNKQLMVHRYLPPQRVKHMFWAGNLVVLELHKRVFFCWPCKKAGRPYTTSERLPFLVPHRRYTLTYASQVMQGLGSTTFKTQQELSRSSFSTVQKILKESIDPLVGVWPEEGLPVLSLGLDCHSFSGTRMLPTLTDLTNHRLLTILPNDKPATVRAFLKNIPEEKKQEIAEVCIDMDTAYLKVIREELPEAHIVVDFFHVVQDGNFRISEARRLTQEVEKVKLPKRLFEKPKEHLSPNEWAELNAIFKAFPELQALWKVKEKIRLIHKTPNATLAAFFYDELLGSMQLSKFQSVKAWAKTIHRWRVPILQYFERHTTNGYTEGVNTKLKTIKRLSYGFKSVDNYIRKALLAFLPFSLLAVAHYLT